MYYANQVHHHKVNGEEPGQKLRESSYSVRDISALLGISEDSVLEMIEREKMPVIDIQHYSIKVDPKQADMLETRVIDGRSNLLIPIDGDIAVNGQPVFATK